MSSRIVIVWLVSCTLLLAQRQISSPDVWWDIAKGREVVAGSVQPSSQTLSLDTTPEADWFGGVPLYLAWTVGGVHLLSGMPILACLLIWLLIGVKQLQHLAPSSLLIYSVLLLCAARDIIQPTGAVFDLIGLVAIWRISGSHCKTITRLAATFLTFLVWANIGPTPTWGLTFLCAFAFTPAPQRGLASISSATTSSATTSSATTRPIQNPMDTAIIGMFVIGTLGTILTPRGIMTLRDSLILTFPASFSHAMHYVETPWTGLLFTGAWRSSEWCFIIMWCFATVSRIAVRQNQGRSLSKPPLRQLTGWLLPLLAVVLCRRNIPVCSLWLFLQTISNAKFATNLTPSGQARKHSVWHGGLAASLLLLMLCDATGQGAKPFHRLGWGIAPEIDPRLLDLEPKQGSDEFVSAWSADRKSTGMVAWLYPSIKLIDHPQRALLGGRTNLHDGLIADFLGAHRARYRRDDGTWGGWVNTLANWKATIVFVPVEMEQLNRSLQKTTWRPLDLDSPTVPFVSTEDLRYAQVILDTMQQERFVETGPWAPSIDVYDGRGWRFDIVEALGGPMAPSPAILQSQKFRSMNSPLAALRALLPLRHGRQHQSLRHEFQKCQIELANQEWTTFGNTTRFRQQVVHELNTTENVYSELTNATSTSVKNAETVEMQTAVNLYIAGDLESAIAALPNNDDEATYAIAMIQLELGESTKAKANFQRLIDSTQNQNLNIASKYWGDQID